MIDSAGAVRNSYTYKPYGQFYDGEAVETVDNPWKFTGQWYDTEIEQYYLRARQYDPAMMRFTSRDPVRGDREEPLTLHRYLYCLNDSTNYTDPTGESIYSQLCDITVGAAVHNTAIDFTTAGIATGNDLVFALGLAMNKCVVPMMNMHHVFPMFSGGARNGIRVKLPVIVHRALHTELYRQLNRNFGAGYNNWSGERWQNLIGRDRMNEAVDILRDVSLEYDNNYGLVESLKQQMEIERARGTF